MDIHGSSYYCVHCLNLLGHPHCIYFDFKSCEYSHAPSHLACSLPTHKIDLVLHTFSGDLHTFTSTL